MFYGALNNLLFTYIIKIQITSDMTNIQVFSCLLIHLVSGINGKNNHIAERDTLTLIFASI